MYYTMYGCFKNQGIFAPDCLVNVKKNKYRFQIKQIAYDK